ncbi:MAG: phosphatidate cytidylyltransferase [Polyangiales bacterium]
MNDAAKTKRSNLAVRFMTAGVAVPVILWMLFLADSWVWPAFVLLLALPIAAAELFTMTLGKDRALVSWGILSCLLVGGGLFMAVQSPPVPEVAVGFIPVNERMPIGLVLWTIATMVISLARPLPSNQAGTRMAWLLGGPLYIGGTLAMLACLRTLEYGGGWVLLSMMLAWFADTAGYFAGRFLGGKVFGARKLSPNISPNKTWEGAMGSAVGCVLAVLVAHFWYLPALPLGGGIVLALLSAPVGICGDLAESLIKRSTGAKDSGWIVPGHGGLIDRIDALMFVSTLVLAYARYVLPY